MISPWTPAWRRSLSAAALGLVGLAGARACGPDFPNRYLDAPDRDLECAAQGSFPFEIARIGRGHAPTFHAINGNADELRLQTQDAELADLRRALARQGAGNGAAMIAQYANCRTWMEETLTSERDRTGVELGPRPSLPSALPAQFGGYFEGACAWRSAQPEEARARWEAVLALPADERQERSTWAAFMLGRYWLALAEQPKPPAVAAETAAGWFRRTRELAAEGFSDTTGLAAASFGWEARCHLALSDYPAAITLYLEQYRTGDASALESLRATARRVADSPDGTVRKRVALDPTSRQVLVLFLVSERNVFDEDETGQRQVARREAWAGTFEESRVDPAEEAGALALLSYQGGKFELADRWAKLAGTGSAKALWVRAKLSLRAGDVQLGETRLEAALAAGGLSDDETSLAYAELGRLRLSLDDPTGALAAWLRGNHWEDAAYTAERVLTVDELGLFVDHRLEEVAAEQASSLRQLLARRLAREGRDEQALRYYAPDTATLYRAYLAAVKAGFDATRPADERARALWGAAQSMREHGMDFIGTELEPDFAIYDGEFDFNTAETARRELAGERLGPTAFELARLDSTKGPTQRFHYRYRAAKLAWWAASLLPNESDETATILATAGGWLKARDPKAANPFYEALVLRCPHTELGRAAAAKHWLAGPAVPDDSAGV